MISINHIRAANGLRAETDWQMRADTRKLVKSINKAFERLATTTGHLPIEAFVRKEGNGIYLRLYTLDADIDRHGNLLGSGSMVVESVDQKDLLAPKARASARSKACNASRSPRPKT